MKIEVYSLGPIETNCTIVISEESRQAAIIDAPLGSYEILEHLRDEMRVEFTALLLTHTHWDHTADAAKIQKNLGVKVYVHPLDEPNLSAPGADGLPMYFPIEALTDSHALHAAVQVGDLNFQVLHTPGHSPGSVCFYMEEEGVLFSGDTLFCGACGRTDLPTSDPLLMQKSLRLLATLPPQTRVFPGHGDETTISNESWIQ